LHMGTRKDLNFTTKPLNLTARLSNTRIPHRGTLAAGNVGLAQANKWRRVAIGLTLS
jgi:hypothetical protein